MAQNNEMIQFLTDEAYSQLKLSNAELLQMVKNIDSINKGFKNAKLPSESVAQAQKAAVELEKTEKAIERQRLAEIKLQQAREKAFDSYDKKIQKQIQLEEKASQKAIAESNKIIAQKEREFAKFEKEFNKYEADLAKKAIAEEKAKKIAVQSALDQSKAFQSLQAQKEKALAVEAKQQQALEKSETAYNRIQASVNLLTKTYQDLAIRKQLGNTLSIKEEAQLVSITKRLNMYQTALKAVDSDIQKHQRNVGNYSSGWNGLSNSINQITRELPAFTFSAQTGFLALSNNIPILTDEIGRLMKSNKELIAQGKPVKSVFSQILGSLLSLQTAMGVGILLFTLYGKEIGNFVTGLFKANRSIQTMDQQMSQLNKSRQKSSELAQNEISTLEILYKTSQDVTLSIQKRKEAVDKMQELYPNYLANISDENILNGEAEAQYYKLRDAILAKYTAQAIAEQITENAKDSLTEYLSLQQNIIDTENEIARLKASGANLVIQGSAQEKTQTQTISNNELILAQEKRLAIEKQNLIKFKEREASKNDLLIKSMNEMLQLANPLILTEAKGTKSKKDYTNAINDNISAQENSEESFRKTIAALEKQKERLTIGSSAYKFFATQIELVKLAQQALNEEFDSFKIEGKLDLIGLQFKTSLPSIQAIVKEVEKYKIQLEDLQPLVSATFDLGDTLFERQISRYDALIAKSNEYYDALISNAESGSAQELALQEDKAKAEEQLLRRKAELERKQAIARKAFAISEIAINTAVAIMKNNAQLGFIAAQPLNAITIALGAIQAATVLAQPIPQYKDGTNYHKGGDAIVGDGGKHEVMITPDGKQMITPNVSTLIKNMPKGTKVMPDASAFYQSFLLNFKQKNDDTNNIEKAIERGFKKAKINNYMKMPKINISHEIYKTKGL
jgi:hypothetical protein